MEEHNQQANSTQEKKKQSRQQIQNQIKYMRDKDREMVKGIFRYYEVPNGQLSFPFRKYPGDEVENFTLVDGQVYTIPLGVAKHLNNDCWYPIHAFKQEEGKATGVVVGKKVHRCGFQSLEFVDLDDNQSLIEKPIIMNQVGL
jgi:hypothetical protein